MKDKILTVLFGIAVFFFIITFSIGLPIYCRFFYYLQIEPLNIPQATGYDYETIKEAFDQLLNYLTMPNQPFGTGVFSYTEAGKAHFVDCKALFDLNALVLIISSLIIAVVLILSKLGKVKLLRPFGMNVAFISAICIFVIIFILGIVIAVDFKQAFVLFHKLLFPGKDNWVFSTADEIITALPTQFFMNCAILIGASIVIISLFIIIFQLIKKSKSKKSQSV